MDSPSSWHSTRTSENHRDDFREASTAASADGELDGQDGERPEKIVLFAPGAALPDGWNALEGRIELVTYIGVSHQPSQRRGGRRTSLHRGRPEPRRGLVPAAW
ncbi:MAG: hypothetical protein ACYCSR_04680 [Thiomonas sp.]|uniref:Uncharacterized protein n=1 Tax=mine drainage metagenome TaxID=410659 RepID=E6PUK5_9ZZZZ